MQMKTFIEFISEKYYEPDQPLPSGKTPYGKATSSYYRQKGEYFRGGRKNPQHFDRAINQIRRRNKEVSRGADNPNFDSKPDKSGRYDIQTAADYGMRVTDRKNDLQMRVRQKDQIAPGRKPVYDVEWYNLSGRRKHNPGQARGVVKSVADMWKNQVAPRIPSNSVLTNFPISNDTSERNTRSKLYSKVAGFGKVGMQGRQYAAVGRPPSSKQAAKGAQRITPLSGNLDPESVYNRRELDTLRTPHKPKAYWAGTERARGQRRQIAPAKPSRPSLNQAVKAMKTTAPVKAPSVPKPNPLMKPATQPMVPKVLSTIKPPKLSIRGGRAGLALGAAALGAGALAAAFNKPKK